VSGDHWMEAVSFGEPFRLSVNGFRNLAAPLCCILERGFVMSPN
jgi:hypothetical protein